MTERGKCRHLSVGQFSHHPPLNTPGFQLRSPPTCNINWQAVSFLSSAKNNRERSKKSGKSEEDQLFSSKYESIIPSPDCGCDAGIKLYIKNNDLRNFLAESGGRVVKALNAVSPRSKWIGSGQMPSLQSEV